MFITSISSIRHSLNFIEPKKSNQKSKYRNEKQKIQKPNYNILSENRDICTAVFKIIIGAKSQYTNFLQKV